MTIADKAELVQLRDKLISIKKDLLKLDYTPKLMSAIDGLREQQKTLDELINK